MRISNSTVKKGFKYGFKLGILFSFIAQLVTFYDFFTSVKSSAGSISHRPWDIGFPFSMYSGWYLVLSNGEFEFNGFIRNLIFALCLSVALGLFFKFHSQLTDSIKNASFIVGFYIGMLCFVFLNYYMQITISTDYCNDCIHILGFPFTFGQTSDVNTLVVWRVLFADVLVAVFFSFILGLIFKFVWSEITVRKLE